MDSVQQIFDRDSPGACLGPEPQRHRPAARSSARDRSLGIVIKLLTPSRGLHRRVQRLARVASRTYIYPLVFIIKRSYRPEWGDDWRSHFSVRQHQRPPGPRAEARRTKARRQLPARRLRRRRPWRTFKPAPGLLTGGEGADRGRHHRIHRRAAAPSLRARPGSARTSSSRTASAGSSSAPTTRSTAASTQQAERDIATPGNFLSNFEPLTRDGCRAHA